MDEKRLTLAVAAALAAMSLAPFGCESFPGKTTMTDKQSSEGKAAAIASAPALWTGKQPLSTFEGIVELLNARADAIILQGDGGSRALVSPRLQGRLLTFRVGAVDSTGLVNAAAILEGDTDPQFNNFGGVDRFWIGPEGGQFGLYFPMGADFDRKVWKVPPGFDAGPFKVVSSDSTKVAMARDLEVTNYSGTKFQVHVEREVGVLKAEGLPRELGLSLPAGIDYAGGYSLNVLTNSGSAAWNPETGLIGIWILGQFNPSDATVIIAPFRPGEEKALGPPWNDDYFGKVSIEAPDRLKVLGNAVLFRADARREGKFGISQRRTPGLAGAFDFQRNLLTIIQFDVPATPERYGNSTWVKKQPEPFVGDALQSYNNGVAGKSGELAAVPFFELESTSPVRPLAPGESLRHRHATHHFQGDFDKLAAVCHALLGVELRAVKAMMLKS